MSGYKLVSETQETHTEDKILQKFGTAASRHGRI
jgi:hypothetical protein